MQLFLFDPGPKTGHQPYLDDPTAIVVSVSGGLDSSACAIWARRTYPDRPLILWHAHLERMDWPHTDDQIGGLAHALGNCRRVSVQAVYELNGKRTPTGSNGTHLRRLHTVRDGEMWYGPAADDDPAAITTLLDLAGKARGGMPPTKKIRYCTEYMKHRACLSWLRANRVALGERPLLLTGERWRESDQRAQLERWSRYLGTQVWDVVQYRPLLDLALHEVAQISVEANVPIHAGYMLQGETLESLLDPNRGERGRARLSCVCCVFANQQHIATALQRAPAIVLSRVDDVQDFERTYGYTWQQRGPMLPGCGT